MPKDATFGDFAKFSNLHFFKITRCISGNKMSIDYFQLLKDFSIIRFVGCLGLMYAKNAWIIKVMSFSVCKFIHLWNHWLVSVSQYWSIYLKKSNHINVFYKNFRCSGLLTPWKRRNVELVMIFAPCENFHLQSVFHRYINRNLSFFERLLGDCSSSFVTDFGNMIVRLRRKMQWWVTFLHIYSQFLVNFPVIMIFV